LITSSPTTAPEKGACLKFKTMLKFTASLQVTWCLFHQGGSSLGFSIQGSEANSQDSPSNLSIYPNTKHVLHKKINLKIYELQHKVDRTHECRQGKEQAKETKAYCLLVVVLAKRARMTCISSKAIFKLLSSGHNTILFVWVSLGRVQEEQVENTWSIQYAPLDTMTTRAP
jgi:hypothetical protein